MSKIFGNKLRGGLFLSALAIAPVAMAQYQHMPASTLQVRYEDAFKPGFNRPKWDLGHLVAWKFDTSLSDTSENLALFDSDGKVVGTTRIWLPDASFLRIEDAAVGKDGNVAVVGWAMTSSGTLAAFLADVAIGRGSGQIIQTSPFEGQAVGFAPDGTIWVLGLQVGPGRRVMAAPDHYMVQHFGTDDVLKDQHLLRSDLSCELAIGVNGIPRVVASSDRIGFFSPFCRTWVELSPAGEVLGHWKWSPQSTVVNGVEKTAVVSVALTSANELYGWRGGDPNVGLVRFDRKSSEWTPLETSTAQSQVPFLSLEGSDGEALVYHSLGKRLAWFQPTKTQ